MSKFIRIIFFVILNLALLISFSAKASEKVKIGLMVPLTGANKEIGQSIIKAVRLAVKDINNNSIEIIPKDTASKSNKALKSAFELKQMGVKVVIGPVFHESISYLDEIKDITFLSLTNKTLDLPKNVISAGINSTSQFNTIKKFIETNNIKRTIFLTHSFTNIAPGSEILGVPASEINEIVSPDLRRSIILFKFFDSLNL